MVSAIEAIHRSRTRCLSNGGELSLPLWERVGVRGHGLSIERNPSPGSHLSMRSDLSHKGRGGAEHAEPVRPNSSLRAGYDRLALLTAQGAPSADDCRPG